MAEFEDTRLRIFMAVARLGSFTKAAAECKLSQPAVSQNISELEKMFNHQLFTRKKGSVELTAHGHKFMKYATQIQYWYDAAREAFGQGLPTQLRADQGKREVFIGICPEIECHLVKAGTPDQDIEISTSGDDLRISIIKKQRSLGDLTALDR